MVNEKNEERRQQPEYDLQKIQEIALAGNVDYGSRRVMRDIENLGYSLDDVCRCLASLKKAHYRSSVRYQNTQIWLDEYNIRFSNTPEYTDDLYIKLKITANTIQLVLASFHRNR